MPKKNMNKRVRRVKEGLFEHSDKKVAYMLHKIVRALERMNEANQTGFNKPSRWDFKALHYDIETLFERDFIPLKKK